jgi:excisionase family DNA binding protein
MSDRDDELMTVAEVAALLKISEVTVRRWIVQGELSAVKLPGRGIYRVRRSVIDRLLGSQK